MIRAALNGQDLETAWKDLGEPTGWANIRKHYRKALQDKVSSSAQDPSPSASSSPARGKRKAAGDAAGEASAAAAPADEAAAPRRVRKVKYPFRLTSSQSEKVEKVSEAKWLDFKAAHKLATAAYAKSVKNGTQKHKPHRAVDIAFKYSAKLDPSGKQITAKALKEWHAQGKPAGGSPKKAGKKVLPSMIALIDVVKSFSKVSQLEGDSKQPDELVAAAQDATEGTALAKKLEGDRRGKAFLKQTRQGENSLNSGKGESIDQRRIDSLTQANVEKNVADWKAFLLKHEFAEEKLDSETGETGVYVPLAKRRRIVQCDETHQIMTTQLEAGGSRSHVYYDPSLGSAARATTTNQRHTTGMYAINYAKEVLPPYYMFDSLAKDASQQKIEAATVVGLPRVKGFFGFSHKVTLDAGYAVTTKGGTSDGQFLEWISKSIDPAFPNIAPVWKYDKKGKRDADGLYPILEGPVAIKTDFGPDRLVGTEEGIKLRQAQYARGCMP